MARSHLHEFDLELCWYVRDTVRSCLPKPFPMANPVPEPAVSSPSPVAPTPVPAPAASTPTPPAPAPEPEVSTPTPPAPPSGTRRPRANPYARYTGVPPAEGAARWLHDQLSPGVYRYLLADDAPDLLLTEEQFEDLATALDYMPGLLDSVMWIPYPPLCDRYVKCLPEIRRNLASTEAERFAEASQRCFSELGQPGLKLWDGIRIVGSWVGEIRRLLEAMDRTDLLPRPEGRQPTPGAPVEAVGEDMQVLIDRIRARFAKDPSLRNKSRNQVQRVVHGNRKKVFDALAALKNLGEYTPPHSNRA